jgi:RNA polymerase sigma-70 factor (ECF subfamily)
MRAAGVPAFSAALSAAEEAKILARVRAGGAARREGAGDLFRRLREPIHAVCLHVTGRREDAEAAVREAFVSVHRGLPDPRGASTLTICAYRIALRAAFRAHARRRDGEPMEGALARLPAGPRAVLSLFAVEGLSHQEIAGILGIPEGDVWTRLRAARRMGVEPVDR